MTLEDVILESFAYGGESFGRLEDQRAVFVPFALPGEKARIRLLEEKRGFARGKLIEVLEASPERIEPRCAHFTQCGGCHYQHIPYELQIQAKAEILKDQLIRIGKIENPPVRPAVPSPNPWNYRNHVQFHITLDGKLGFQARRSHEIIPIRECHLPEAAINQIWPLLDLESIPGLDRLSLRVGAGEDVLLTLESSDPQPVELEVDLPISVVYRGPEGSFILAGDDHIFMEALGRTFRVSAGSFFQVNTNMAGKMAQHILENLDIPENATLIDAYCGVGLFSTFLAPRLGRLIGIESSSSACEDFAANLDEFDHVELYEAPVDDVLPALEPAPDILVVDPPRAGLGQRTLDGILSLAPGQIVYISCDPATLSRDVKRLIEGSYHLRQITPFDLFPQTYHIESISFWSKI
jgi:23S rRNA (uracil1939-C5)-methyltransferase